MDLKIKINDRGAVIRLNKFHANLTNNLRMGIVKSLIMLQTETVKNLTSGKFGVKTDTGRLRGSLEYKTYRTGQGAAGVLGSNLVYARIQELGGIITPKSKDYLTFQIKGRWVKTKSVTIPPHYYLRNTLKENKQKVLRLVARSLMKDLKK